MKVLYCASEVSPIIKVGGLGDVAGSLPKALQKLSVDIRIVVPCYEGVRDVGDFREVGEIEIEFDNKEEKVKIWEMKLPGSEIPVYLLENNTYLSIGAHQAVAGTEKEIERFVFFSKAIVEWLKGSEWKPDLIHLNDWHTSLIPLLQKCNEIHIPSLLTIHNLAYQGIWGSGIVDKLGINQGQCKVLKWDLDNRDIDILMEGIIHADFVNTVSPTYAKEILTPEYGEGIEEILKGKEGRVSGILNGIDADFWDPSIDPNINFQFSILNSQLGKEKNKQALQKELGFVTDAELPVVAYIGRIEPKQKGLDIIYEAMEKLLPENEFQFILLGTGDKEWETKFSIINSPNFKFIDRFDEKLAHQIYAGADIILVPSKFEPCGLPQMISMRYGALPIVRKTGGLADSVKDGENGFVFEEYSGEALGKTIKKALGVWGGKVGWEKMMKAAMETDFSWDKSAKEYLDLYNKILGLSI